MNHDDDTCPHLVRANLLKSENARLKAFSDEAQAHIAKEERKSRERLDMEQAENARLKAEVERLEHQVNYWRIEAEVDNARWLRCLKDYEELRASSFVTAVPVEQYERVVKAGDALVEALKDMDTITDMDSNHPEVEAWNAAKEGKPSA